MLAALAMTGLWVLGVLIEFGDWVFGALRTLVPLVNTVIATADNDVLELMVTWPKLPIAIGTQHSIL